MNTNTIIISVKRVHLKEFPFVRAVAMFGMIIIISIHSLRVTLKSIGISVQQLLPLL